MMLNNCLVPYEPLWIYCNIMYNNDFFLLLHIVNIKLTITCPKGTTFHTQDNHYLKDLKTIYVSIVLIYFGKPIFFLAGSSIQGNTNSLILEKESIFNKTNNRYKMIKRN